MSRSFDAADEAIARAGRRLAQCKAVLRRLGAAEPVVDCSQEELLRWVVRVEGVIVFRTSFEPIDDEQCVLLSRWDVAGLDAVGLQRYARVVEQARARRNA